MDGFIKKIFEKKASDSLMHVQFQKFSRGDFKNKAMMNFGKSKDRYSIITSSEFANEFVRAVAEKTGATKVMVTGGIITTADLTGQLDFSDKKQFMGVKQYVINKELSGNEILAICDKFPLAFTALSFTALDGTELKIKPNINIKSRNALLNVTLIKLHHYNNNEEFKKQIEYYKSFLMSIL